MPGLPIDIGDRARGHPAQSSGRMADAILRALRARPGEGTDDATGRLA